MNAWPAILVDTNVLVYSYDPRDQDKRGQAQAVMAHLVRADQAVLSTQCLVEFYNTVTRRLPERMPGDLALAQVERLARLCRVIPMTPSAVLEGCRGSLQHQMSLWDALIWAVAKLNQVPYVLTEDAEHGRFLEGVRYLNPFAPEFDLRVLGGGS